MTYPTEILYDYQEDLAGAIRQLDHEAILVAAQAIFKLHRTGEGRLYLCGNGGSASTASHMVCDLTKNAGMNVPMNCLSDNVPIFSAYANDDNYRSVFLNQLGKWMLPDDLLIAISTSGESENVYDSLRMAYHMGAQTILLTGNNRESSCALAASHVIYVESNNIGVVEDVHLIINHMLTEVLREMDK